jgi:hypothetical protein
LGYLYKSLRPSHAYFPNWLEYRRLHRQAWIATVGFIPAAAMANIVGMFVSSKLLADVATGLLFFFVVGMHYRAHLWPCPRCNRRFGWTIGGYASSYDRCSHCGLDKYAPCDPAVQEWEHFDPTGKLIEKPSNRP